MLAMPTAAISHAMNVPRSTSHAVATTASDQDGASSFGDMLTSIGRTSPGKSRSDMPTPNTDASSPAPSSDKTAVCSRSEAPKPPIGVASDATPPAQPACTQSGGSAQAAPVAHAKRPEDTTAVDALPDPSTPPTPPNVLALDALQIGLTPAAIDPHGSGLLRSGSPEAPMADAAAEPADADAAGITTVAASADAIIAETAPDTGCVGSAKPATIDTLAASSLRMPTEADGGLDLAKGSAPDRLSQSDAQAATSSLADHGATSGSDGGATGPDAVPAADSSAAAVVVLPAPPFGASLMPHAFAMTVENGAGASMAPDGPSTSGPASAPDVPAPSSFPAPVFSASIATADGANTSIRVSAGELGTIEVTLGKSDDGSASVTVAADRSDTLSVMAADHDQMQSVLAQAGVETTGRRIEYTLLPNSDGALPSGGGSDTGGGSYGQHGGSGANGGAAVARPGIIGATSSQNQAPPRSAATTVYMRRTTVDITA